jgi:hypothetical protein
MANTSYRVELFKINPNAQENDVCGNVTTSTFSTLEAAHDWFEFFKAQCVHADDTVELLRAEHASDGSDDLVDLQAISYYP